MKKRFGSFVLASGLICSAHGTVTLFPIDITGASSTQSSAWPGFDANGAEAIDGNTGNISHTADGDLTPWWEVNLGVETTFSQIAIHNRDSCCQGRLSDFTVQVRDGSNAEVYNSGVLNPGDVLGSPAQIDLDLGGAVGAQWIKISRDGSTGGASVLALAEVQLGLMLDQTLPTGTNLTQAGIVGMTVAQSTSLNANYGAGNGVDGDFGNFTHTAGSDINSWWQVDFGEMMILEAVSMFNRTSCCGERLRDIMVSVLDGNGDSVFTSDLLNPGNAEGFGAGQLDLDLVALNGGNPIEGQTVVISRLSDPTGGAGDDDANVLSLGEVEVFGASIPEPSSLTMFGLLGLALGLRRKR